MKKTKLMIAISAAVLIGIVSLLVYRGQNRAASDNVIRIGAILPLTGAVADDGFEAMLGVQYAIEKINESGKTLQVKIEDGKYTPKDSISAIRKLIDEYNVDAVSVYGVVPAEALMPTVRKYRKPLVATAVGAANFPDPQLGIVRMWFPIGRLARLLGEFSLRDLKSPSIALLCINNSYGLEAMDAFKSYYMQRNGIVSGSETFAMDALDLRPQLSKLLEGNPNAFFVSGFGQGYITAINQLREPGFRGAILTDTAIVDPKVRKSIKSTDNIYYTDTCFLDILDTNMEAAEFCSKYKMSTSLDIPSMQSQFSYVAIKLAYSLIKGGLEESLMATYADTILGEVSFNESGEIWLPIIIRYMHEGGVCETVDNELWEEIK